MEKRTSEYWQERFQQLEETQHDTSVQTMQSIEQEFRRTEQVLDGKINAWYQRFASNNKISMIEARRLLNSDELEEFKWDVQDYIKYGEENGINQQHLKYSEVWVLAGRCRILIQRKSVILYINRGLLMDVTFQIVFGWTKQD